MALVEVRAEVGGSRANIKRGQDGIYEIIVNKLNPKENDLVLRMYFNEDVYTTIKYENESINLLAEEITFSGFRDKRNGEVR